jgi:hypothetical protein
MFKSIFTFIGDFMIRILLASLFIACAASQTTQHPSGKPRTINIQGSAEMKLVPNIILWNASIESTNKDLEESRRRVDAIFNAIKTKLTRIGIKDKDIKLYGNSQSKQYDYEKGKRRFRGYRVLVRVDVKARDLKLYQNVNNILLTGDDIRVTNTRYDSNEKETFNMKIMAAAAEDAKTKASLLANVFGQKIGRPITIKVHQTGAPQPVYARGGKTEAKMMSMDAGNIVDIADHVGTMTIRRSINVTFELLDQ